MYALHANESNKSQPEQVFKRDLLVQLSPKLKFSHSFKVIHWRNHLPSVHDESFRYTHQNLKLSLSISRKRPC